MSNAGQVTQLARSLRKTCTKIREEEFLTPGQIRFYSRLPEFKELRDACVADAKDLLNVLQVVQKSGTKASSTVKGTVEDIKDYVVDVTEKIDVALDRHRICRHPSGNQAEVNVTPAVTRDVPKNHQPAPLNTFPSGARPQDSFYPPVDVSNTPFTPDYSHLEGIATDLPTPPGGQARSSEDPDASQVHGAQAKPRQQHLHRFIHPFATALDRLPGQYPAWMLEQPQPITALPFDSSPFTYVDSTAALAVMVDHLSSVREFAVDLEHSDRSFLGFTCLMQISTRSHDYIIDTLALRSYLGSALAAPFADPLTLKVLHGADRDVEWLQKDFGLFVVNMFDTGQAAHLLSLPRGLGKLLSHFCQASADKSLQMADWRKRPLTKAMLRYARMDTHYLLYIADMLRLKLLQTSGLVPSSRVPLPVPGPQGPLGECLEQSRRLTLKLYQRPLLTPHSYLLFYKRCGVRLNHMQLSALAALYAWRDRTARALDESTGRLLPNRMMLTLSQRMPQTTESVLRIAGRHKLLIRHASEVGEAVAEGLKNPVAEDAQESAAAGSMPEGGEEGGDVRSGSSAEAGSLGVEDASDDGSADMGNVDERKNTARVRAVPVAAATERPVAAAEAVGGAEEVAFAAALATRPGSAAVASEHRVGTHGRRGRGLGGALDAEEDSTTAVFEAVSFAALPTKSVKVPAAGVKAGRKGEVGAGALRKDEADVVLRQDRDTGAQPQQAVGTAAAGDAALQGAATATMSAMFGTAIKRRPITVRKGAAGVNSLGGMFGNAAPAPVTVVPSKTEGRDDGAGACDAEQGGGFGRDKRAEVAAAAAALRDEADREPMEPEDAEQAESSSGEEELLSVRERFGQKRKSEASLLGDVTTMQLSQRRGKAKMLRLRNQVKPDGEAAPVQSGDADVEMFDYEAVLDGSDRLPSREGRGGRGRGERGRGDRGRGDRGGRRGRGDRGRRDSGRGGGQHTRRQVRGDEHRSSKRAGIFEGRKGGGWNPYALEAEKSTGKRSGGSAPKSANKSSNFRS